MTNKKESPLEKLSYNPNHLELAKIAGEYLNRGEEGIPYAQKSLELMLKDTGHADPWIKRTFGDPSVISKAIKSALETYQQYSKDEKVGEILDFYKEDFQKYLGGNKIAEKELKPFLNENYNQIEQEYRKASHIRKGEEEHNVGSDKEIESAKKVIEKYKNVLLTIQTIKQRAYSKFKDRVEDEITKDIFKQMYSEKKEESGGESQEVD